MSCCTPTNPSGASGLSGAWPGCAPAIWPRSRNISASRALACTRPSKPAGWRTGKQFRELVPHLDLFLY